MILTKLLDIPFFDALKYAFSQSSYLASLIPATVILGALAVLGIIRYKKTRSIGYAIEAVAAIAVWSIFFFAKIEDVMTNTTPEQVLRHIHIG